VEERHFLHRAPVAAVKRVGADEVERAGDGPASPFGEEEQDAARHALAQQGKARRVR
jgi:hypothetical protein